MTRRVAASIVVAVGSLLAGCATVTIDNPKNGSTVAKVPQDVRVTAKGTVSLGNVFLDNENLSQFNNSNWQFGPRFWLTYAPPGQHTLFIAAENTKTHQNLGESTTFTVSACPLCYACQAGSKVHPITGQCCANNLCDTWTAGNSGVMRFNSQACQKELAPGVNQFFYEQGCISPQEAAVQGASASGGVQVSALRFVASQSGALTHIRVPIGVRSGPGNVRVWITADGGGRPGTPLETIAVSNLRAQTLPITSPISIFSVARPMLTAGTTYWLVIGPADPSTAVAWNRSLDDFSIPNTTTFMVNRATSDLSGPWVMENITQVLVPAYEIAVRQ